MIFSSGLGIEITDSFVRLARVSYFGRVLETTELVIPTGLVADDLVIDPKGFQSFFRASYSDTHRHFRSVQTVLVIPESHVFHTQVQEGISVDASLQKQIPLPLSEMIVAKEDASSKIMVVEKIVYEAFVSAIDSDLMDLRLVVSRVIVHQKFVLYFKQKEVDKRFEAAIGAAFLAAHPWRFRHSFNFFTYEPEKH